MKTSLACVLVWALCAQCFAQEGKEAAKKPSPFPTTGFVNLKSLTYEEAKLVADPYLSKTGKLGFLASRNMLVIHDLARNVDAIKAILGQADTTPVNIRIEVIFSDQTKGRDAGIRAEVRNLRTPRKKKGKKDWNRELSFGVHAGMDSREKNTSQFIVTSNGRSARIWVGKEVHDRFLIGRIGCRRGWWEQVFVERKLGASLWVLPKLIGDGLVEIELYPRITQRGEDGVSIDVRELALTVIAADGQIVSIGGLNEAQKEFYAGLFGIGKSFNGRTLDIQLRTNIMRPRSRKKRIEPKR